MSMSGPRTAATRDTTAPPEAARGRRHRPRRAGIVISVAGLAAAALLTPPVAQGASAQTSSASAGTALRSTTAAAGCSLSAKLVSSCGLAFGAYVLPGNGESQINAFGTFSKLVKHDLDIIHVYHRGSGLFPTAGEQGLTKRAGVDRTLLINWKPEGGLTWAQVAAGRGDSVINAEARYLKANYQAKFFLAIHHEPENDVRGAGTGFTAKNYRSMYRHVVNRFRALGVTNVVYVMNYMGAQKWAAKWWFKNLYPGYRYVDWIAFDPYLTATAGTQTGSFKQLMNLHWGTGSWQGQYRWAAKNYPRKPIMLAEWGIGEKRGSAAWKANFYRSVIKEAKGFPKLKALVYFSNPQGASGNAVPNTSSQSLSGFQSLAASGIFM